MKIPDSFMVIDDDPTNNMICELILRRSYPEADIKLFTCPEKALEAIKERSEVENNESVVLFLDINMPLMTGWEFLDVFKEFNGEIHRRFAIFILSSSVDERDKAKADSNPFVSGFLSKPLQVESVKQIFNEYIQ